MAEFKKPDLPKRLNPGGANSVQSRFTGSQRNESKIPGTGFARFRSFNARDALRGKDITSSSINSTLNTTSSSSRNDNTIGMNFSSMVNREPVPSTSKQADLFDNPFLSRKPLNSSSISSNMKNDTLSSVSNMEASRMMNAIMNERPVRANDNPGLRNSSVITSKALLPAQETTRVNLNLNNLDISTSRNRINVQKDITVPSNQNLNDLDISTVRNSINVQKDIAVQSNSVSSHRRAFFDSGISLPDKSYVPNAEQRSIIRHEGFNSSVVARTRPENSYMMMESLKLHPDAPKDAFEASYVSSSEEVVNVISLLEINAVRICSSFLPEKYLNLLRETFKDSKETTSRLIRNMKGMVLGGQIEPQSDFNQRYLCFGDDVTRNNYSTMETRGQLRAAREIASMIAGNDATQALNQVSYITSSKVLKSKNSKRKSKQQTKLMKNAKEEEDEDENSSDEDEDEDMDGDDCYVRKDIRIDKSKLKITETKNNNISIEMQRAKTTIKKSGGKTVTDSKAINLKNWYPLAINNDLAISGINEKNTEIQTAPVTKRCDNRTVQLSDGFLCKLIGKANLSKFPQKIALKLKDGLHPRWRILQKEISEYQQSISKKSKPAKANLNKSQTKVNELIVNTPKARKSLSPILASGKTPRKGPTITNRNKAPSINLFKSPNLNKSTRLMKDSPAKQNQKNTPAKKKDIPAKQNQKDTSKQNQKDTPAKQKDIPAKQNQKDTPAKQNQKDTSKQNQKEIRVHEVKNKAKSRSEKQNTSHEKTINDSVLQTTRSGREVKPLGDFWKGQWATFDKPSRTAKAEEISSTTSSSNWNKSKSDIVENDAVSSTSKRKAEDSPVLIQRSKMKRAGNSSDAGEKSQNDEKSKSPKAPAKPKQKPKPKAVKKPMSSEAKEKTKMAPSESKLDYSDFMEECDIQIPEVTTHNSDTQLSRSQLRNLTTETPPLKYFSNNLRALRTVTPANSPTWQPSQRSESEAKVFQNRRAKTFKQKIPKENDSKTSKKVKTPRSKDVKSALDWIKERDVKSPAKKSKVLNYVLPTRSQMDDEEDEDYEENDENNLSEVC